MNRHLRLRRAHAKHLDISHTKRRPKHMKRAVEKPGRHAVLSSECGTPCVPKHWSSIMEARAYARMREELEALNAMEAHTSFWLI